MMALARSGELPTVVFRGSGFLSVGLLIRSVKTDCFENSFRLSFSAGFSGEPLISESFPQLSCRGFVREVDFSFVAFLARGF